MPHVDRVRAFELRSESVLVGLGSGAIRGWWRLGGNARWRQRRRRWWYSTGGGRDELRWVVTVTPPAGHARRFTHSTFLSRTLTQETLRKHDPSYRPALSARGQLERDLLAQIDGTKTLDELRAWVLARGGAQFTPSRLAELLASTIERCG